MDSRSLELAGKRSFWQKAEGWSWCSRVIGCLWNGDHQVSSQPGLLHMTFIRPLRALRAAVQSHGSQVIVTVPGSHGWCRRHSAGQGTLIIMPVEHSFDQPDP